MKVARITHETTTTITPPLAERIAQIEEELKAEWERFIDNHMFDTVPRSASEAWAWGEIGKLRGDRLQFYSRVARWLSQN